ncbi:MULTISPECIES: hypothetical protein [Parachlamydia]|jgi:hypothetical protein|uniref:Uncharacterized protein n=2 Tax=Parachlamydia acanthamoebae TaxID=83552 RepID=F8L284_PARAV|nr:hypothetical protein [Parachlamydia acanthamoebae]EFB42049.1 hypothetical protein pah_c016o104 [Parachlamydia acanthamoebae str. Hall's coccus]KIA76655.1 hypothetical protein DB43_AA00800 [Parachlamydia acanthamoebae]CCB84955.1 putative uncharacterized protein [Parachlamydia acanthamoebae UV-7]
MVKSVPKVQENTFAYSPKFSRSWHEKKVYQNRQILVTSAITTVILGFLATLTGILGLPPQTVSLGTCTSMMGVATAVALRSLRKRTQIMRKQKHIYKHLQTFEAQLNDGKCKSIVQGIQRFVSTHPLSIAYMRDYQKFRDSLIEVTTEFSEDPVQSKEWKKIIGHLHKLPFYLADGRVIALDLKREKSILKGKDPFSGTLEIKSLTSKPSRSDLKAIQSIFKQSAIQPEFSKKRASIKKELQKPDMIVKVVREKNTVAGLIWLKKKPGALSIKHCISAGDQPSFRKIEEELVNAVLAESPTDRLKVCALQGDSVSQEMFKNLGFAYAGVKSGLHGLLEDGMIRMTRENNL